MSLRFISGITNGYAKGVALGLVLSLGLWGYAFVLHGIFPELPRNQIPLMVTQVAMLWTPSPLETNLPWIPISGLMLIVLLLAAALRPNKLTGQLGFLLGISVAWISLIVTASQEFSTVTSWSYLVTQFALLLTILWPSLSITVAKHQALGFASDLGRALALTVVTTIAVASIAFFVLLLRFSLELDNAIFLILVPYVWPGLGAAATLMAMGGEITVALGNTTVNQDSWLLPSSSWQMRAMALVLLLAIVVLAILSDRWLRPSNSGRTVWLAHFILRLIAAASVALFALLIGQRVLANPLVIEASPLWFGFALPPCITAVVATGLARRGRGHGQQITNASPEKESPSSVTS